MNDESADEKIQRDCDQATNDMSSTDIAPNQSKEHQQSPSQPISVESNGEQTQTQADDDDEDDRQTNHLYPYSSINSIHNHYGNDDDDDCNSSEDTKTSCPSKCDNIKTEQHNGQQQQVCLNLDG